MQAGESDLAFLTRLWRQEGLAWHFRSSMEGSGFPYVIHDAGKGEVMGSRIGPFAQALTTSHPEFQWPTQNFNTSALLGEMRAGTAVTNMALAIAWTHQKGKPVLVAGTTGTAQGEAVAVVVTPPARPRIADPEKNWFRARGEGNAYLMWWGLRKDYDWNKYGQGFSD